MRRRRSPWRRAASHCQRSARVRATAAKGRPQPGWQKLGRPALARGSPGKGRSSGIPQESRNGSGPISALSYPPDLTCLGTPLLPLRARDSRPNGGRLPQQAPVRRTRARSRRNAGRCPTLQSAHFEISAMNCRLPPRSMQQPKSSLERRL